MPGRKMNQIKNFQAAEEWRKRKKQHNSLRQQQWVWDVEPDPANSEGVGHWERANGESASRN